jgi:hypothetical protein
VYEVASDLDMRAIHDGQLRPELLDEGNEARHLWIVYAQPSKSSFEHESKNIHVLRRVRGKDDSPMKAMSTPPGASGPPSAVHLNPFF